MAKKVASLPKKGSRYWTRVEADVQLHQLKHKTCSHQFAFVSANVVECMKCHIGFGLIDEHLKDGHIYKGKKLLI